MMLHLCTGNACAYDLGARAARRSLLQRCAIHLRLSCSPRTSAPNPGPWSGQTRPWSGPGLADPADPDCDPAGRRQPGNQALDPARVGRVACPPRPPMLGPNPCVSNWTVAFAAAAAANDSAPAYDVHNGTVVAGDLAESISLGRKAVCGRLDPCIRAIDDLGLAEAALDADDVWTLVECVAKLRPNCPPDMCPRSAVYLDPCDGSDCDVAGAGAC